MADKVTFTVDAEHAQAIGAFLNVSNAMKSAASSGEVMGEKVAAGGEKAAKAWDGGLSILKKFPVALGSMLGGFQAIQTVIGLMSSELARLDQVRGGLNDVAKGAKQHVQLAQATMTPGFQKLATTQRDIGEGIQLWGEKDAGGGFHQMLAGVMSAKGVMDEQEALNIAMTVAKMKSKIALPQESMEQIGQGITDAANSQRRIGLKPTAGALLGQQLKSFAFDRPVDIGESIRYGTRFTNLASEDYGWKREQAMAMLGIVGSKKGDQTGRPTSTSAQGFVEHLYKAYIATSTKHAGLPGLTPEEFKKLDAVEQLGVLQGENRTGYMMESYMFGPKSFRPEARKMSRRWDRSPTFMGHYTAEKGYGEAFQAFTDKNSQAYKDWIKATAGIGPADAESEKYFNDRLNDVANTPQGRLYAAQNREGGVIGRMGYTNTLQARRGNYQELVKDLGTVTPTGSWALQQSLADLMAKRDATGATGAQLDQLEIEAAQQAIRMTNPAVKSPLAGAGTGAPSPPGYGLWDAIFGTGKTAQQRQTEENEKGRKEASPEVKSLLDALETFIKQKKEDMTRNPEPTDSSMLQNKLDELIAAVRSPNNVFLHDEMGREISRGTSAPRPIEQFYDTPGVIG
jgi:hypothetical protein